MKQALQLAGCAAGVLLAAACSSGTSTGGAYQKPASSTPSATQSAAASPVEPVGVATAPNALGTILTDATGRALYVFDADTGPTSTCIGACAHEWPPFTAAGTPAAGTGVDGALLATNPRSDGTLQVVYNGHPLYYYDDDHGPGTTAGQGESSYGAKWYLLTPAGLKIDHD